MKQVLWENGDLAEANRLFSEGLFADAASIYRSYIEDHGDEIPEEIDGLGHKEISSGYYEWFLFRHYKEGCESKEYVGTAYDALALCCLGVNNQGEGN